MRAQLRPSIGEEILGLFLQAPMATIGGVLVGFVPLLLLTPSLLPNIGLYNPLFWGGSALLESLINYRTGNRSAYWVGAIAVLYLVSVIFRIFLTSIGYSIGAWFRLTFRGEDTGT